MGVPQQGEGTEQTTDCKDGVKKTEAHYMQQGGCQGFSDNSYHIYADDIQPYAYFKLEQLDGPFTPPLILIWAQ